MVGTLWKLRKRDVESQSCGVLLDNFLVELPKIQMLVRYFIECVL